MPWTAAFLWCNNGGVVAAAERGALTAVCVCFPAQENRRGAVRVRRVFRGVETPREVVLGRAAPLTDYQLVARHEEAQFCRLSPQRQRQALSTLPATLPKPALLLVGIRRPRARRHCGVAGAQKKAVPQ